ncbi:hypothetical protein K9M47_00125 [Candidatus Gracilibacteria bacterium]|nr:hypothetical protein [Candidatus Gracilibacteria bacterium]MCF7898383.1 hypothetical protein [Candidatus Paceibacterota bacterium]
MKRILKKYINPTAWLTYLRKQPKHMQHVYSAFIAGGITMLIAVFILYVDYGFWHERYIREDTVVPSEISNVEATPESPTEMLSRLIDEARIQLQNINTSSQELMKGKETYINDSN